MANQEDASGGLFSGLPGYVSRTPWGALGGCLATLLIIAGSIGAAVLVVGAANVRNIGEPGSAVGRGGEDLAALATLGAWQVIAIALTVLASGLFGGRPRDVLSLRRPAHTPGVYVRALLIMVGLQVLLSFVQYSVVADEMFADLRPFARLVTSSEWTLALVVVGIGAPLSEELLFRGFLLSALARSRIGYLGGSVVTTACWTALHAGYSTAGIAEVFVIGLFFCWLLWRTGSLRVAIVCHALYNTLVVLVLRHVPLPA